MEMDAKSLHTLYQYLLTVRADNRTPDHKLASAAGACAGTIILWAEGNEEAEKMALKIAETVIRMGVDAPLTDEERRELAEVPEI